MKDVPEPEARRSNAVERRARREYRMAELAKLAGITVRTLRFYRERKLIPPPRREGRIAWYDDRHLARLRTIAALLRRGHTLNGIAELAEASEHGRDVSDLLGLGLPSEETPVRLSPGELADMFGGNFSTEDFAAALELGYLGIDGEEIVHVSRRLVDISAQLVAEGVPLSAVLAAGKEIKAHTDALARLYADLILTHAAPADMERLRPLAKGVVEAELSLSLDRAVSAAKAAGGENAAPRGDVTPRDRATPRDDATAEGASAPRTASRNGARGAAPEPHRDGPAHPHPDSDPDPDSDADAPSDALSDADADAEAAPGGDAAPSADATRSADATKGRTRTTGQNSTTHREPPEGGEATPDARRTDGPGSPDPPGRA